MNERQLFACPRR